MDDRIAELEAEVEKYKRAFNRADRLYREIRDSNPLVAAKRLNDELKKALKEAKRIPSLKGKIQRLTEEVAFYKGEVKNIEDSFKEYQKDLKRKLKERDQYEQALERLGHFEVLEKSKKVKQTLENIDKVKDALDRYLDKRLSEAMAARDIDESNYLISVKQLLENFKQQYE